MTDNLQILCWQRHGVLHSGKPIGAGDVRGALGLHLLPDTAPGIPGSKVLEIIPLPLWFWEVFPYKVQSHIEWNYWQ